MDKKFIKISKVWTEGNDYNDDVKLLDIYGNVGFSFYIYCRMNEVSFSRTDGDYDSHVNIGEFLDMFGLTHSVTRSKYRKELLIAIQMMQEDGIITFYSNLSFINEVRFDVKVKNHQALYCNVEKFEKDKFLGCPFTRLTRLEFVDIMEADSSSRLELLMHYVVLLSFENNKTNIFHPSLKTVGEITGYAEKTGATYNDILVELGVLYYDNAGAMFDDRDKQHKQKSNTYGRIYNKSFVDDEIAEIRLKNEGKIFNVCGEQQKLTGDGKRIKAKMKLTDDVNEIAKLQAEYDVIAERKQDMYEINDNVMPKSMQKMAIKAKVKQRKQAIEPIQAPEPIVDEVVDDVVTKPVQEPQDTSDKVSQVSDDGGVEVEMMDKESEELVEMFGKGFIYSDHDYEEEDKAEEIVKEVKKTSKWVAHDWESEYDDELSNIFDN